LAKFCKITSFEHALFNKKSPKPPDMKAKKAAANKPSEAEQVAAYMDGLQHPLRAEVEAVRMIIKSAHDGIQERIKWNAPSYYYKEDLVTFHLRSPEHVHLVFHHPAIEQIDSALLEGNYVGRRMVYFKDMQAVKANQPELIRILQQLVGIIDDQ